MDPQISDLAGSARITAETSQADSAGSIPVTRSKPSGPGQGAHPIIRWQFEQTRARSATLVGVSPVTWSGMRWWYSM
jgi:hypothetical protein